MFRYPLRAIVQQSEWRLDARQMELADALGRLEGAESAYAAVGKALAAAVADLRQQVARALPIDAERQRRVAEFLRAERQVLRTKKNELEEARRRYEAAREALQEAQRSLRLLEQHRERFVAEWRRNETNRAERAADELWLLTGGTR